MKKSIYLFLLVSSTLSFACSNTKGHVESASFVLQEGTISKNVPVKEFDNLIKSKKNALLLDVRTPKEVAAGHLANSTNIDFYGSNFKEKLAKLDKNKPVLVYCHSGHRSGLTMKTMKEMGFKEIYNLETGIMGWKAAGMPVVK